MYLAKCEAGGAITIVAIQENVSEVNIRHIVEDTGHSNHVVYNIITDGWDMKTCQSMFTNRLNKHLQNTEEKFLQNER